jgi:hypothetical protein
MTNQPTARRSVEETLDLLNDSDFCAEAKRTILEAAQALMQPGRTDARQLEVEKVGQRFEDRWGVPPPMSGELLDSDPRRRFSDAIAAGRWGLVVIFPWTTNRSIGAGIKGIRSVVRKRHQDAMIDRHAHLVRWLEAIGFDRPTIARAVFGRRSGLRRPTTEEAIAGTREERESQLFQEFSALGLTVKQATQKVFKRLRGSEARASAAVRMTGQRYVNRVTSLNEDLAAPVQSEPLSHALTMLYRALLDDDNIAVRGRAVAVREAFVKTPRCARPTSRRRDHVSEHQPLGTITSAPWCIVSVFPWTTDSQIRASVKKLRDLMRQHPQNGVGATATARPSPFEPLSDALISLFRALSNQDDTVVRRYAAKVWATFLEPGAL